MCGRFANQLENSEAWEEYFGSAMHEQQSSAQMQEVLDACAIGYNIAPTQMIPVITKSGDNGGRTLLAARWGMIGPWVEDASEISSKFAMFSARSEKSNG